MLVQLMGLLKFIAQQKRENIHVGRLATLVRYASVFQPPEDASMHSLLLSLYDVLLILFKPRIVAGDSTSNLRVRHEFLPEETPP